MSDITLRQVYLPPYRAAVDAGNAVLPHMPRFVLYNPANGWGRGREVPTTPGQSFHAWYKARRGSGS